MSSWNAPDRFTLKTETYPMTLRAFQLALCELVASPALCIEVRKGSSRFLDQFDLSELERLRLLDAIGQRGMSANCTLYRSNHITPIYTLLHYTCWLLGDQLKTEMEEYWRSCELLDLQYKQEIDRFGRFLKRRIAAGTIRNPFLREVLDFELALNELRFSPRRRILRQLANPQPQQRPRFFQLHPLVRVLQFQHKPIELLERLARKTPIPIDLCSGQFYVALSAVEDQLEIEEIDSSLGEILSRLRNTRVCRQSVEIMELAQAGLVVPSTLNGLLMDISSTLGP